MLGVARHATTDEIRRAWIAAARVLHPDAGGVDDERVRAVNEAWHVLRDPVRRLAHDRDLGIDHGPRYEPWDDPRPVPVADQFDELDERTARPSRVADLVVLVPAGLLAVAVACFAVGTLMLNATLFVLAVTALVLSGVTFAITPFVTLALGRRRARR